MTYGKLKGFVAHGANEDGSDGTVRASAASLDSIKMCSTYRQSKGNLSDDAAAQSSFAFKLVAGKNHSGIVPRDPQRPEPSYVRDRKECFAINEPGGYQKLGDKFAAENQEFYDRQKVG